MRKARPINSCEACRRRRLRCDKVRPACSRCITSGGLCTYANVRVSETGAAELADVAVGRSTLADEDRVKNMESTYLDLPEHRTQRDHGSLLNEGWGRTTYLGSTFWGNALRITSPDEVPFRPGASGAPAFHGYPRSNSIIPKIGRLSRKGRHAQPSTTSQCHKCGRGYGLSCVLGFLPPKSVCQQLTRTFFESVFPLTPIFHTPTIRDEVNEFWESEDVPGCDRPTQQGFLERNPSFLALYLSILFSASMSIPRQSLEDGLPGDEYTIPADLYVAAVLASRLVGFPRSPSLYALAGFILVESPLAREEEFSDGSTFVDTAFRVALTMGLHRDAGPFLLPAVEAETRKRLWWHVIHLDAMWAASSGLAPLFMDVHLTNHSKIAEYGDISTNEGDGTDIRLLVANGRYCCTNHIRRIVCGHLENSLRDAQHVEEEMSRLTHLTAKVQRMISLLNRSSTSDESIEEDATENPSHSNNPLEWSWYAEAQLVAPAVAAFRTWSVSLLHLLVHKAHLALYEPLYRASPTVLGMSIRERALSHAQAYTKIFLEICAHPNHQSYSWIYPRVYQPLQALAILIAELHSSPWSDASADSRGLVDSVLQLYEVDEGIVGREDDLDRRNLSPYGREAWTCLLQARSNALKKAGKDPHVLFASFSRGDQLCVCGLEPSLRGESLAEHQRGGDGSVIPGIHHEESTPDRHIVGTTPAEVGFDWGLWDALGTPSIASLV